MKTLKWILLSAALMVLTFAAVSGTLGDESANDNYLYIVQSELMRSDSGLVDAADTQRLLPAVYTELNTTDTQLQCNFAVTDKKGHTVDVEFSTTEKMYTAENALDYIVVATNTGNVDGYVRTWFAFELGELTIEAFEKAVLLNKNADDWTWGTVTCEVIDGQRYAVVCAEYVEEISRESKKLPAGATTAPSLLQVMLCSGVSNETAEKLDGNGDGNYEVRAHSQVVSTDTAWHGVGRPWQQAAPIS